MTKKEIIKEVKKIPIDKNFDFLDTKIYVSVYVKRTKFGLNVLTTTDSYYKHWVFKNKKEFLKYIKPYNKKLEYTDNYYERFLQWEYKIISFQIF